MYHCPRPLRDRRDDWPCPTTMAQRTWLDKSWRVAIQVARITTLTSDPEPPCSDVPTLLDVLALDELGGDTFRSTVLLRDAQGLYGGQVAAQALVAAAATTADDLVPHSLHCYFLR